MGTVRKREPDDPLTKRHIGKDLIGQQCSGLGHPAGTTAGAEPALAGKRYKPLEATAFEVRIKLSMYMSGQALAFGFELSNQG